MLCQFQVYSKVNLLYIYIHISTLFFQILFPYRSLQSIEQSSLCCIVGPYQLSILYIVVCSFLENFIIIFKFLNFLFIYFWLRWVFVAARGLSLVEANRGYSSLWCTGFSLRWLLLLQSTGSRHVGFSSCGTWAQQLWLAGSRVKAQQLWRTGLVAPQHVGSSWTRDQTHVPCVGRWILNHCATGEVPSSVLFKCMTLQGLAY